MRYLEFGSDQAMYVKQALFRVFLDRVTIAAPLISGQIQNYFLSIYQYADTLFIRLFGDGDDQFLGCRGLKDIGFLSGAYLFQRLSIAIQSWQCL